MTVALRLMTNNSYVIVVFYFYVNDHLRLNKEFIGNRIQRFSYKKKKTLTTKNASVFLNNRDIKVQRCYISVETLKLLLPNYNDSRRCQWNSQQSKQQMLEYCFVFPLLILSIILRVLQVLRYFLNKHVIQGM